MRYIFKGIADYCRDCWHDFWFWWWDKLERVSHNMMKKTYCWKKNDGCFTKEGNLQHYIKQRQLSRKK